MSLKVVFIAGPTAPLPPSTPSAKKPRARPRNVIILDGSDDEATPTRAPSFGESPNGPTIPFSHPAGAVGSPTPQLPVENDQPDDYNRPNQQRRGGNSEAALSTASSEDGTAPATNLAAATGLWSPAKTPEPSERLQPPLRTPEPSAERPVRRGASPSGPESGHVAGSHVADWHVARADVAETGLFKESLEKGESAPEEAKASDGSNEIGEQAPSGLESVLWGKGSARGDHPGCKKGLAGEPGTAAGRLLNGSQGTAGGAEAGGRQPGKDGEATGQPARVGGSSTSNQLDGEETNRGAGSVSADTGADIVRASARYKSKAPAVTVAGDAPDSLRANAALPSEEQDSGAEERPVTAAGAAEAMEGPDQTRPAVNQSCPESGNEEGEFQGDASGEGRVTAEMKGIDRASVGGCPREVGGLGGEAPKGVGERALGTEEAKAGTGTPFEGAVR